MNPISYAYNKLKRKVRKAYIWTKYKNHTKFHFLERKNIFVDGEETHGVPLVNVYDDKAKLSIGKYCSIAADCLIIIGGNHHTEWVSTYAFYQEPQWFPKFSTLQQEKSVKHGNITIGNDVWIGRNVILLPGADIGDGAVIGGGSVVAGKIPPYAIAVGNPTKIIKYRFTPEQIDALLKIKWWNWSHEEINAKLHLICNNNINAFIDVHISR